ncbi:MAG: phosphoribosyltransferase [Firmicutes bacterium]|nr:phosphoribosyltransferase [Bacillota bacterium]
MFFADRIEAGRRLAEALRKEPPSTEKPRVIGALPRGGVVVGAEVAATIGLPLEVLVARKIGAPGQPEVAIGAVAWDGTTLLNEELIRRAGVPQSYIEAETRRQAAEAVRLTERFRRGRPLPCWREKEVIVVDDGIATGYTVRAAVHALRGAGAAAVWVAAPVAPQEVRYELASEVDRLIVLHLPPYFWAVGEFYERFDQVEEEEVVRLLDLYRV